MKPVLIAAIAALLAAPLPESANAQSSAKSHSSAKPKISKTGGVETIKPQEAPSKESGDGNGWNGLYVGVNAGGSFGATTGSSVVVPFGTSQNESNPTNTCSVWTSNPKRFKIKQLQ